MIYKNHEIKPADYFGKDFLIYSNNKVVKFCSSIDAAKKFIDDKIKVKKDKDGWYKFCTSSATVHFINDELPNIICSRLKVPGLLHPKSICSGVLSKDKKTFTPDGKINLDGIAAGLYYKNKKNIKKLLERG